MPPPNKKQKLNESESSYEWVQATPGDLNIATAVLYEAVDGPRRGVIYDAFEPVDHYWVEDEETCEVVRTEEGDCHDFHSADLKVAKTVVEFSTELAQGATELQSAGVLLIGTEPQMLKILKHFGESNTEERTVPQQLLAIPCVDCVDGLAHHAATGVNSGLRELAKQLRDDIQVGLRVAHLKHVTKELGEDVVKQEGYFCLASVHLPCDWEAIEEVDGEESLRRKDLWNQIDLCITATGEGQPEHSGPVETARVVLGEHCGLEVSDELWRSEVQTRLRGHLNLQSLPLRLKDQMGAEVFPLLLPSDAAVTSIKGVLCFGEAPDAWYLTQDTAPAGTAPTARAKEAPALESSPAKAKTVRDWEAEQEDEFGDLPPIPAPWIRVRSRKDGKVYYWNKETQKASFKLPTEEPPPAMAPPVEPPVEPLNSSGLPPGWTQHVSKSNGKIYYFHEATNHSQYFYPKIK